MDSQNRNPNETNQKWQEDRQNKEMRLWELGAKGNIAAGWWQIARAMIGYLAIIGMLIYLWFTKQSPELFQSKNYWSFLIIIIFLSVATTYYVGLGIWQIVLGKSKLQRQKWTWWYSIVTLPLAYIYSIFYLFYKTAGETTLSVQLLIIGALTLGFGVLYYYVFSIKHRFEPAATEPIKNELQELSRWPLSKDRPLGSFIIGILMLILSIPAFGLAAISFGTSQNTIYSIIGFLLGISIFIAGIGLMRAKKYGFYFTILSTIFLAIMAFIEKNDIIYFYLIGVVFFIIADIYLSFEKERFN